MAASQQTGSIRGIVYDADFDAPLPGAQVTNVETGERVTATDQGNFVLPEVPPGAYTLVFSKDGYVRQVRADVVVSAGQLTDVDARLTGEFVEMEEFVVQDVLASAVGTEAALLQLRFESPALLDSISADLMSRAGASDAASALRLVAGASVQDGKFAVIRGLPDRYVSSQLNGVRLPTADEDTRAVELDQFPSAVIESIQVSKTFTPDQQGDASGGAVDVRLKSIPEEVTLQVKGQVGANSQVTGNGDYLSYEGGGVNFWGIDDRPPQTANLGRNWSGAVGVKNEDPGPQYKFSIAGGGKHTLDSGVRIGGFATFFYERDNSFFDNGFDDSYWRESPGAPLTPRTSQGLPSDGDFRTNLFDVTQASDFVQWGGLATFGVEWGDHAVAATYLHTRTSEDVVTLAEDTRGKEYYFPGHDPYDNTTPGHANGEDLSAPYLRLETLDYTERTTDSFQLTGRHPVGSDGELELGNFLTFTRPEFDWTLSTSSASLDQPDKRQFGSVWFPEREPIPGFIIPSTFRPYKPAANVNLGNLQRIFKTIDEDSLQASLSFKMPFEQWGGYEGYARVGMFADRVDREFRQDTYSNFGDSGAFFEGRWDEFWSASWPFENHPITAAQTDVQYDGSIDVTAFYGMFDLPVSDNFNIVAGARVESTEISVVNDPDPLALWFPPDATAAQSLDPGEGDVDFEQAGNILPSIGLQYKPTESVTLRAAYAETVARQTFKELTPILQQEFLGGPIFIGNPFLQMSGLQNYDFRVDYEPYPGGLLSGSLFHKDITNPIENVQRVLEFDFTTAVNYPKGRLTGYELEVRQDLGRLWEPVQGLSAGVNYTYIDSEVTLPADEQLDFMDPNIMAPRSTRDATNAPEFLFNFFLTQDWESTGTQLGVFYTIRGDTLIAGAGQANGFFVPDLYAQQFDTLNLSLSQRLTDSLRLTFQVKNLTDPRIDTEYRSDYIPYSVTRSSFTRGVDFSVGVTWNASF